MQLNSYEELVKTIENNIFNRCNHLLTLSDRDEFSGSLGSFDRAYWQYKIKDFSSEMSQEAIYPLALAVKNNIITQDTKNILKIKNQYYMANSLNKDISWKWLNNNNLIIKGKLCKYKKEKMTTLKLIILRLIMFFIGKYFPNLIRKIMQKVFITPNLENQRLFERELIFEPNKLKVNDRYYFKDKDLDNVTLHNTSFNSFKHVVMSRIFHHYLRINSPKYSRISKFKNYINMYREW